jgi:ABC-type phosphate transport system auxiliary subunit
MAEIEYGGVKLGGSKLLLIVPLIGTIVGGLWGGFEGYQKYLTMEKKINSFVSPDLSDYDKRIAIMENKFTTIDKGLALLKDENTSIKADSEEQYLTIKDLKQSMRDDIDRQEKIIDKVEDDLAKIEIDVRSTIEIADGRFESKRDQLQNDYEQKSDTIRADVERKLSDLEARLNKKLQRALDNPLSN